MKNKIDVHLHELLFDCCAYCFCVCGGDSTTLQFNTMQHSKMKFMNCAFQ